MRKFSLLIAITLFSTLTGCGPSSLNEVHLEASSHRKKLTALLSKIENKQDLLHSSSKIRKEINALTDLMILAKEMEGDDENRFAPADDEKASSDLREAMMRVYRIEGARDIFENLQRDALHRLDYAIFKSQQDKGEA